jgi:hypothetical protein
MADSSPERQPPRKWECGRVRQRLLRKQHRPRTGLEEDPKTEFDWLMIEDAESTY